MEHHRVIVSLGSNISPVENLRRAVELLRKELDVQKLASTWETTPVGTTGPNFYNTALLATSPLIPDDLKYTILRPIEVRLGRVRTADKYAPRPIDLDLVVYDDQILDTRLWTLDYLAIPIAELVPDLSNPLTSQPLEEFASRFRALDQAILRPEVFEE
jgi:2-amino-4-hydroxy-6-hydroxymethyldihydropteridine diphosphokinase